MNAEPSRKFAVVTGDVVAGWQNKLRSAMATITPSGVLAEMHRGMAEPGSGEKK